MFKLSRYSLNKLRNVDENIVSIVKRAIELTEVDFTVICGVRTLDEQKKLVAMGKSQTLFSKHILGQAVDLAPYIDGQVNFDNLHHCCDVAEAMRYAAIEFEQSIRWGGCWCDITKIDNVPRAMDNYIKSKLERGRKPFIDAFHFELM